MSTLPTVPYSYRVEIAELSIWVYPSGFIAFGLDGSDEAGIVLTHDEFIAFYEYIDAESAKTTYVINERTRYVHEGIRSHLCRQPLPTDSESGEPKHLHVQTYALIHGVWLVYQTLKV